MGTSLEIFEANRPQACTHALCSLMFVHRQWSRAYYNGVKAPFSLSERVDNFLCQEFTNCPSVCTSIFLRHIQKVRVKCVTKCKQSKEGGVQVTRVVVTLDPLPLSQILVSQGNGSLVHFLFPRDL